MPDNDDLDLDDDEEPTERTVTLKRSEIRALEKKARRLDEVEAKLSTYERDATFRAAGLNPDDKRHARFIKGYDGDLTAEAIKATAIAEEFLEAEQQDSQLQQDAEALARTAAASTGGAVLPPDFKTRLDAATTKEEALAVIRSAGGQTVAVHGE